MESKAPHREREITYWTEVVVASMAVLIMLLLATLTDPFTFPAGAMIFLAMAALLLAYVTALVSIWKMSR